MVSLFTNTSGSSPELLNCLASCAMYRIFFITANIPHYEVT